MASFSPQPANNQYQGSLNVTGADGNASSEPWIVPPTFSQQQPPPAPNSDQLTVEIAGMAGAGWASPGPSLPTQNNDFSLNWTRGDSARVNADPSSEVWKVAQSSRTGLAQSWAQLRADLETLESQQVIVPGGAYAIAQRVAEALPLAYSEVLSFRYGLDATARSVDLVPGMRLRVEHANSEYVSPSSPFNGFTGSGASYWQLDRRSSDQAITFDAFVGGVAAYPPVVDPAGQWGVVGAQQAGPFTHLRLVFPPQAFAPWPGSQSAAQGVTIIGAMSRADLNAATDDYVAGNPVPTQGSDKLPIAATFFHGRAIVVPELPIFINDHPAYAPVGTTVRDVAERYVIAGFNPPGVSVARAFTWTGANVANPTWATVTGMTDVPTQPTAKNNPTQIVTNVWDLPVVKGDKITLS